ncbi:MAG TPA: Rid family hydrolase [Bauldia sp.]|nr:Rid family hydrolase [Bauldia sp.]
MTPRLPLTRIASPDGSPATGSYSPAIVWNGLVFVSGQGPIDPRGAIVSGSIESETELTLRNVEALLKAAGSSLDRVVKCSCFLADIGDFDRFDAVYRRVFSGHLPARTTVQAGLSGIKVEIDAIAVL